MASINHDEKFTFYEEEMAQIVPRQFFEKNLRYTYNHTHGKMRYNEAVEACGENKVRCKDVVIN